MSTNSRLINFPTYTSFWRHNISAVLWALLILALCGVPRNAVPETTLIGVDKVVHCGLYALFGLILIVGFSKQQQYKTLRERAVGIAIGVGVFYGILIEVLQGTVFTTRSLELLDMLANTTGAFIGVALFYLIYGRPTS